MIMGFIDTMRAEGHVVESICRVLGEQGCQVAARTYRSWKGVGRVVSARTVSDAHVVDAVRDIAWTTKVDADGVLVRKLAPEGLYGRRKMTAYLRRTAPAPDRTWVTDSTYVRTWAGFTYVAFIVDVYAQRIVAWHAATDKQTDLVMIPLQIVDWLSRARRISERWGVEVRSLIYRSQELGHISESTARRAYIRLAESSPSTRVIRQYDGEVPSMLNAAFDLAASRGLTVGALASQLQWKTSRVRELLGQEDDPRPTLRLV